MSASGERMAISYDLVIWVAVRGAVMGPVEPCGGGGGLGGRRLVGGVDSGETGGDHRSAGGAARGVSERWA